MTNIHTDIYYLDNGPFGIDQIMIIIMYSFEMYFVLIFPVFITFLDYVISVVVML